MTKDEILTSSKTAREQEVAGYQINIDNYTLAIAHIEQMPANEQAELAEFKTLLTSLLASEKLEQKKAKVMLAVVLQQLQSSPNSGGSGNHS